MIANGTNKRADVAEIRKALSVLHPDENPFFEVRILGVKGKGREATASGYFDNIDTAAKLVAEWDTKASGIYITANPPVRSLFARAPNRIIEWLKPVTQDSEIVERRWLLIDFDPERPSGIASTDEEKSAAMDLAHDVEEFLSRQGWRLPISGDSGNGFYLLYPIALPNDETSREASRQLIELVLKGLHHKFREQGEDKPFTKIDTTMHNASRIVRLFGTTNCKGFGTPDRPHRRSYLNPVPEGSGIVTREQLEAVAALAPKVESTARNNSGASSNGSHGDYPRLDFPAYLAARGVAHRSGEPFHGGTKWILEKCPFNVAHTAPDSYAYQTAEGIPGFSCSHNSCSGNKWQQFKDAIGKPDESHYDRPFTRKSSGTANDASSEVEPQQKAKSRKRKKKTVRVDADERCDLSTPVGRTDAANAVRFAEMHGRNVHWIDPWKKWLVWNGTNWGMDRERAIDALAKQTSHAIWNEVAKTADKIDTEELVEVVRFGKKTNNAEGVSNMLAMAKSEPGVPLSHERLDRDPWKLYVPNGELDLKTGTIRPHRRENYNSKLCRTVFDPAAECPLWLSFLDRIMDRNERLIAFIQQIFGYCLTGTVGEQILPFLWGQGANGKSTLLDILLTMLGPDYAMQAPDDLLVSKRQKAHPTELADLFGKRAVACIETDSGCRMAESLVKQLTGGDRIRARRMKEDFWEFEPTHKVLLAANHKPTIQGTDLAIWRRVRLVPFTVVIPPEERDKALPEKLKKELSGVLAWALRGCLDWQANGLQEPDEVRLATEDYRGEMDLLSQFLEECCYVGKPFKERASKLYERYREWIGAAGEYVQSQRQFGAALTDKGFEKYTNNGTWYRGLATRDIDATEPTEGF